MLPEHGLLSADNLIIGVASWTIKRAKERVLVLKYWEFSLLVVVDLNCLVNGRNICAFRSLLRNNLTKGLGLFFKIITLSMGYGRTEGRLKIIREFIVALLASHEV